MNILRNKILLDWNKSEPGAGRVVEAGLIAGQGNIFVGDIVSYPADAGSAVVVEDQVCRLIDIADVTGVLVIQ